MSNDAEDVQGFRSRGNPALSRRFTRTGQNETNHRLNQDRLQPSTHHREPPRTLVSQFDPEPMRGVVRDEAAEEPW